MEYVRSDKGKFWVGENEFRFRGANMYELLSVPEGDPLETAEKMLLDAKGEGFEVIRCWAFEPTDSNHVHKVCDIAGKLGIRLILCLADKWGYRQGYQINKDWYTGGFEGAYLQYAKYMVRELKDRAEIMIWELVNEPIGAAKDLFNFADRVSQELKVISPEHIFSMGTVGGLGGSAKSFRKINSIPTIQAASIHDYSYDSRIFERLETYFKFKGKKSVAEIFRKVDKLIPISIRGIWRRAIERDIAAAHALNKPVYIGEAGYKKRAEVEWYKIVEAEALRYFELGVWGFLLWSFESQGWSKDGHGYGFGSKEIL
jgi:endo-1,4-beta-mannosidase